MNDIPDTASFVATYGGPNSALSPRLAWRLWATALTLAEAYADEGRWDLLKRSSRALHNGWRMERGWHASFAAST